MKKLKHLLSWLIVFMLIFSIMPTAVFASPCCYAQVTDVSESDGVITIGYSFFTSNSEERQMRLTIYEVLDGGYFKQVYTDTFTKSEGGHTYTLDSINLLNGVTYQASVDFNSYCEWYSCDSAPGVEFTVTQGMPHFYYDELPDGMLDLVGHSRAAITATITTNGFYSITAADEYNNIKIGSYPNDNHVANYEYYEANNKVTFIVSTYDESDLSTTISFGPAATNKLTVTNENPLDGDKLINISDYIGLSSFTITKEGLYSFSYTQAEEVYGSFRLYAEDGTYLFNSQNSYYGKPIEQPLFAGTYYIDTAEMGGEYDLSVTYTVPDEIEYGITYNIGTDAQKYFSLKATQPAYISREGAGINFTLYNDERTYYLNDNETACVIPAGTYYVDVGNAYSAADVIDKEFTLNAELIETMTLDTPVTPSKQYPRYGSDYYYIAFGAPEAGTYEFDFSKCSSYSIEGEYTNSISFFTREMKKDEYILFFMSTAAEISVTKYSTPAAIPLTYDETKYCDWYSGKAYIFSFTPDADGLYKFVSNECLSNKIKIYTDSEVLYESDTWSWDFSKTVELKKDVTTYISFYGEGSTSATNPQIDITVTTPYIKGNDTVDISNTEPTYVYCTADTSGYYEISMQKVYDYQYNSISAYVDGKYYYVSKYNYSKAFVYIEAGEPIEIKCTYDGDTSCQMEVILVSVAVQDIAFETAKTLTAGFYYNFTAPEDGVYKISKIVADEEEKDETSGDSDSTGGNAGGDSSTGSGTASGGTVITPEEESSTDSGATGGSSSTGGGSSSAVVVPMPEVGTEEGSVSAEFLASSAATGGSGSGTETIKIDVSSSEGNYLALPVGLDAYFAGTAGTKYLIEPDEDMDIIITAAEATELKLGTEYTTGEDVNIFEVNIPSDGLYRVKTPELCNTDININLNGEWQYAYEHGHSLFELKAGKNLIITEPITGYKELSAPKAKFALEKATSQAKLGTELIDVYYDMSWGCPVIECSVTAPYEINELYFGIEFTNDAGSFVSETIREVGKYYTDKVYETIATDLLEKGKTYTIKPFITVGEESEKIYGAEKTITVDIQDAIKARYNTVKIPVKLHNGNTYTKYQDVTIEFTQPEDAEGRTYITYPEFMYSPSVYNENGNYIARNTDENGEYYYSFTAGTKYYLTFMMEYDCVAEIGISSLPNPPEETAFAISDAAVSGSTVSFTLAGSTASDINLFAGIYSESGKLLELKKLENPSEGANSVSFSDITSADKCKLMVMESITFKPLCSETDVDLAK